MFAVQRKTHSQTAGTDPRARQKKMANSSIQFEPSSMNLHRRSPEYNALLLAGPRLGPLKQAHARLVVAGHGSSLPLTTKLAALAVAADGASYAHLLAASHPAPDSFLFCTLTRAAAHRGFPAAALTFYATSSPLPSPSPASPSPPLPRLAPIYLRSASAWPSTLTPSSSGLAPIGSCRRRLLCCTPSAANWPLHASCSMQFVTEAWSLGTL